MKASWALGSRHKVNAEDAYEEFERIRGIEGNLDPEIIVPRYAAKRTNPLHADFVWDDAVAANIQRVDHARTMLRHIKVVREELPNEPVRAYEVVAVESEYEDEPVRRVYDDIGKIMANPSSRNEVLERAIRELNAYRKKYKMLSELAVVFAAMDKIPRKKRRK